MCLMHSEAKNNTTTSEFGAEEGLLQGHARRLVDQALKTQTPPENFQQSTFIGKMVVQGVGMGG